MKYVRRIASEDQNIRRNEILSILRENEVPFKVDRVKQNNHWVENIIISYNPSHTRLVIGAHYDSVDGSTGANDNGAAVSILIKLAKIIENTNKSIDLVFFDREEYQDHGSEAYIKSIGKDNISSMVNLDMCGFGETISISHKGNIDNPMFHNILKEEILAKHKIFLLGFLPNGDDDRFTENNIPNISIAVLPKNNALFFEKISELINKQEEITEDIQKEFMQLEIVSTMHNAPNDKLDIVTQESMDMLLNFLVEGLV